MPLFPIFLESFADEGADVLAQTPNWLHPEVKGFFRLLRRDETGIGEIVFETRFRRAGAKKPTDRNFRVFAKLRITEHDCVMFLGSEKRRGNYYPAKAPALAKSYLARFERNEGFVDGHI